MKPADLDRDPFRTRRRSLEQFAGGVDVAGDSAGIEIEPPRDFPASQTACMGCPGASSRLCCQHAPSHIPCHSCRERSRELEPAPTTIKPGRGQRRRWPFGRRTAP